MTKRLLTLTLLLLLCVSASAQGNGYNAARQATFITTGSDITLQQNSLIAYHEIIWTPNANVATCTASVDSSVDGITWTTGGIITSHNCASAGNTSIPSAAVQANYIRLTILTLTGTNASVTIQYEGWAYAPAGSIGSGSLITGAGGSCNVGVLANGVICTGALGSTMTLDDTTAPTETGISAIGGATLVLSDSAELIDAASQGFSISAASGAIFGDDTGDGCALHAGTFSCNVPISGGAVSSVFGRTGAVIAATNDYNFNQLAGTLSTTQVPTGGSSSNFLNGAGAYTAPASAVPSVFGRTGAVVAATNDYNFNQLAGTWSTAQVPIGGSATAFLNGAGTYTAPTGAVLSVSNSDGTLTCSPTTSSVTCSIALGHANTWTAAQTFNLPPIIGSVGGTAGSVQYLGTTSGNVQPGCVPATTCTAFGSGSAPSSWTKYNTTTNCGANGTAANPSVVSCGSAGAGSISCSASASAGTCTVNDTAVTANSNIILTSATYIGTRLAVTCNTAVITGDFVSAVSAGTSFTITLPVFTTNPECFTYQILN